MLKLRLPGHGAAGPAILPSGGHLVLQGDDVALAAVVVGPPAERAQFEEQAVVGGQVPAAVARMLLGGEARAAERRGVEVAVEVHGARIRIDGGEARGAGASAETVVDDFPSFRVPGPVVGLVNESNCMQLRVGCSHVMAGTGRPMGNEVGVCILLVAAVEVHDVLGCGGCSCGHNGDDRCAACAVKNELAVSMTRLG